MLAFASGWEVTFVAAEPGPVTDDQGGLSIQATASYADVPRPDVIVVPGGIGTIEALSDQALVSWISEVHEHTPLDDLRLRRLVPAGVSKALALGRAR